MPARGLGDLVHDLRILGPRGLLAAATSALTVQDVLNLLGLGRNAPFRAMIAMLLQDTAQAGPEIVPFANAAACLHAYRSGMSRPRGGMRALAEGIGRRFVELGGDLRTATLVDRVEAIAARPRGEGDGEGSRPGFVVVTRRRHRLLARQVAFNLPLDLAARLLDRPLSGGLARSERKSRAAWSAFTGYLAIGRDAVPDETPLFHQVLQSYDRPLHDGNNVLVSLSPVEDEGYGPPTVRVATLSTHTRPGDWEDLDADAYRERRPTTRPCCSRRWPARCPMRRQPWPTPSSPRRGVSDDTRGAPPEPSEGPPSRGPTAISWRSTRASWAPASGWSAIPSSRGREPWRPSSRRSAWSSGSRGFPGPRLRNAPAMDGPPMQWATGFDTSKQRPSQGASQALPRAMIAGWGLPPEKELTTTSVKGIEITRPSLSKMRCQKTEGHGASAQSISS